MYQKAYAARNAEKKAAYSREYRSKPENKAKAKAYWSDHVERRMWHSAKRRAREKGIEFTLCIEDITIPSHCPVFGTPLETGHEGMTDASPSVDRIDNTKGYVKGNVWVISWRANRVKCDATLEELEALVTALRAKKY